MSKGKCQCGGFDLCTCPVLLSRPMACTFPANLCRIDVNSSSTSSAACHCCAHPWRKHSPAGSNTLTTNKQSIQISSSRLLFCKIVMAVPHLPFPLHLCGIVRCACLMLVVKSNALPRPCWLAPHCPVKHTHTHTHIHMRRNHNIKTRSSARSLTHSPKHCTRLELRAVRAGAHIHTYIHTYILTYVQTYKHTNIHTYTHTYTHTNTYAPQQSARLKSDSRTCRHTRYSTAHCKNRCRVCSHPCLGHKVP